MDKKSIKENEEKYLPRLSGKLRAHSLQMPEVIRRASGIVVLGRRVKSIIFTTDVAIIRNCDADAVLAVYPFTPQQIISQALINSASIPVFCGVGGGLTTGARSALIARDAEANGAFGVVVNAPTKNDTIKVIKDIIDIPIIVTVLSAQTDIQARLDAGASILNISAASATPEVVREIRAGFPKVPIIATGGPNDESISATINAGANAISYTPPATSEIFAAIMKNYREEAGDIADQQSLMTEDRMMEILKQLL